MAETYTQRADRMLRELADVRASAESDNRLIAATVDRTGRLQELRLDPRVYRDLDVDDLAQDVVTAVREAGKLAHREAVEVAADLLPGHRDPDKTDLGFDPVLEEFDRQIANPAPPRGGDPPDETLPVLRVNIDYRAFRRNLLDLREQMARLEGTGRSDDGLIEATADGYGRLRDLRIDRRVYRVTDSRRLAADITYTVRKAAEQAAEQVAGVNQRIWAGGAARRPA